MPAGHTSGDDYHGLRWTDDARLVALYDIECLGRRDHGFYLDLARELPVRNAADVGCGTGVFAAELAAMGLAVTGVDPSSAMIAAARQRPGGEGVTWLEGHADALPVGALDLVLMNGHVAQYFLSAEDWMEVLGQIARALQPGGYLAFESRNPAARGWEAWTEAKTRTTYPHPGGGEFTAWSESLRLVDDGENGPLETHLGHSLLPDGTHLVSEETLRFRPLPVLTTSLERAGFTIEASWGDWKRSPVSALSPEFIFLARKSPAPASDAEKAL